MKLNFKLVLAITVILTSVITTNSYSQSRLPGTIIYKDGRKKLPDGTIIYPNGTEKNRGKNRRIDDVFHPGDKDVYSNKQHRNNGQWMPPGQAKKVYGGDARDYAPGHNKGKGKWKQKDNDEDRNEHGNGRGHKDHEKDNEKDD